MKKKPSKGIDVVGHFLVPPMHILNDDQAAKLLKKYGISRTQLPRMFAKDPGTQSLNAKVGDIVAIERNEETGKYISYRVVVEDK